MAKKPQSKWIFRVKQVVIKGSKNLELNNGIVATTISQHLHKIRKAPLLPFFSKRAVLSLEPQIHAKVSQLCTGLASFMARGEPVELNRAFLALTLDVITDYCFNRS